MDISCKNCGTKIGTLTNGVIAASNHTIPKKTDSPITFGTNVTGYESIKKKDNEGEKEVVKKTNSKERMSLM